MTFLKLEFIESKRTTISVNCIDDDENCILRHVEVESRLTTVSGILNRDVETVQFESSSIKYFPEGLKEMFPNLKTVVMQEVGLSQIRKYDLKDLGEELIHLDLYKNKFEWLERDLFKFNPNLKYMRMQYTNLKYIDSGFFDEVAKLTSLETFDLSECGCISKIYDQSNLYSYQSFETHLTSDAWDTNSCLKYGKEKISPPDFSKKKTDMNFVSAINLVRSLSTDSYNNNNTESNISMICDCTENISISCSCKTKIERENSRLKEIILDTSVSFVTKLEFVGTSLFMYFPSEFSDARLKNLELLTVRSCGLVKIERRNFEHMKTIKHLDFSDNLLMTIPRTVFDDLTQLEELSLSSNEIESIDVNTFDKLKNLKVLELDKNNIKFISAGLFEYLSDGIEYVFLEDNNCIDMSYPYQEKKSFTDHIFEYCMKPVMINCIISEEQTCHATELNIYFQKTKIVINDNTENPIDAGVIHSLIIEDQVMQFIPLNLSTHFPHLEQMSVNNSMLSMLLSSDFKGFSTLKTLEMTNNNITKIADNIFDDLRSLEFLDMSANEITNLPNGIFFPLISLKTLNLSENKLTVFRTNFLLVKNVIDIFDASNNEITEFESRTLKHLRKAQVIDLTGNSCIDVRYDRSTDKSDALMNLFGKVEFNCNL